MDNQSKYQQAIIFATEKHSELNQLLPGTNLPYLVHLSNVAMEILMAGANSPDFDLGFAVQLALLHDTIEDTSTKFDELERKFGKDIACGVLALSKNGNLPKVQQMQDTLERIKNLQPEVWAVKLADRITNLQPPPTFWDVSKRVRYRDEAIQILTELGDGNDYLANRLEMKIEEYLDYI